MQQVIIALSGRKGSGKNTLAKFIGEWWASRGKIDETHPAIRGRGRYTNWSEKQIRDWIQRETVFEYSFADDLKTFCVHTLGLTREACYGSDEDKNASTEYVWENASPYLRWKFGTREIEYPNGMVRVCRHEDEPNLTAAYYNPDHHPLGHRTGEMSGRDIMQLYGTDLVRHTFGNVWAAATIRLIKRTGKPLSLITDNRFPNEIEAVLKEDNAYIIRLTRSPFGNEDIHPSEAALDDYDWHRERCFVLDNAKLTIDEQNEAVVPILKKIFGDK